MIGEGRAGVEPVPPERLDGYVLRERIGQGGMGVVHRAVDPRGAQVAVKLLHPHVAADAESRARFAREARVLARVRGRHIAEVLDADVVSETPYLVTRFVNGRPLADQVEQFGPLTGQEIADLAGDLADALVSVHAADIVHRDLKPANVLIENGTAVVIDFGIAQLADESRITRTGLAFGTPGYVAPEVLSDNTVVSAGDVHAWAATVAFAATGRHPFGSGPLEAVAFRVLREEPDLQGCPGWLVPILRSCLAKRPEQRPTANELVRWLETGRAPAERHVGTVVFPSPPPQARPLGSGESPEGFDPHPGTQLEGGAAAAERPAPEVRGSVLRLVLFGMLAVSVAMAAVLPVFATLLVVCWLLLARTVDGTVRQLETRRSQLGSRRSDGVVATLSLPWHLGRAALLTALSAPIAVAGGLMVALLVTMIGYAAGAPARIGLLLAVGAVVGGLGVWYGLDGASVRRGSRRLLVVSMRTSAVAVGVAIALALLTMLLMSGAAVADPVWWPATDPFEQVRDRVGEYVRFG